MVPVSTSAQTVEVWEVGWALVLGTKGIVLEIALVIVPQALLIKTVQVYGVTAKKILLTAQYTGNTIVQLQAVDAIVCLGSHQTSGAIE